MKRIDNLMDSIVTSDNLYMAWIKARKGKQTKPEVLQFERELDKNIIELQRQLLSGRPDIGHYHYFTISDPKIRQICAASFPERILHHAVMNICDSCFERHFIFDTYATRKHKGTYAALDRAKYYAVRNQFFVKLDIRKYFDSIDHQGLKKLLVSLFKDNELLELFDSIIDSYQVQENEGLPIGNLTSQYFANYYLSPADHFAKEQLQIAGYIRYMDDILMFGNDKMELKEKMERFMNFVTQRLLLQFKPVVFSAITEGIPFLGYKIFPYYVRLNRRSKVRFKTKFKICENKLSNREWGEKEYQQRMLPLLAFVKYADTFNFRKSVIKNYEVKNRRL